MRAKSHIAILLGSLILINLGHNIIPHHHHLDDTHSHEECEQHDLDDHTKAAEEPARHCHAFNDLQYIPKTKRTLNPDLAECFSGDIPAALLLDTEPVLGNSTGYLSGIPPTCVPGYMGTSPGLRAPPLI